MMSAISNIKTIASKQLSRSLAVAAALGTLVVVLTISIVPFGTIAGPIFPAFVLIDAVAMSFIEILIAYFFTIQFYYRRDLFIGALAGAYGYVAVLVLAQTFFFPGVFLLQLSPGTSPQISVWIWVLWHTGFPLFILLGLVLRMRGSADKQDGVSPRIGFSLILSGPVSAIILVFFCRKYGNYLPTLISGSSYNDLRHSSVIPIIIISTITALSACILVRDFKNLLIAWLTVALLASLGDVITSISGNARYDLGWYAGKLLNFGAASIIFFLLIHEIFQSFAKLILANGDLNYRSTHDGLTGIKNRYYFSEHFPREVLLSKRNSTDLSFLLIDIDHFKKYNDTYGHLQGDRCLFGVATAISDLIRRPGDFVARYGGEEFAVVLPQTNSDGARLMAERIRSTIAALEFMAENGIMHSVTVSIGFVTNSGGLNSFGQEEVLRNADLALYEAKHLGRNRVIFYGKNSRVPQGKDTSIYNCKRPI